MIWFVAEEQYDQDVKKHAGGKAREDLTSIFNDCGFKPLEIIGPQAERLKAGKVKKLLYHYDVYKLWMKAVKQLNEGDTLILQFPVINHTLLLNRVIKKLKQKKVRCIAFVHDLDLLRMGGDDTSFSNRWRIKLEEKDELHFIDTLIVHNESMKQYIHEKLNVPEEKLEVLGIFDYLIPDDFEPFPAESDYQSVIIAGNLQRKKSAYIYQLPDKPNFELYGINYEGNSQDNIHYHGSFLSDDLPFHLKGGFGLVWDGDSPETCTGLWGEYLKYNNPHKTSLYLACGIPVIIWKQAALASFILENKAGFVINSLDEIGTKIPAIDKKEYEEMRQNALKLSVRIRKGEYTRTVLYKILKSGE